MVSLKLSQIAFELFIYILDDLVQRSCLSEVSPVNRGDESHLSTLDLLLPSIDALLQEVTVALSKRRSGIIVIIEHVSASNIAVKPMYPLCHILHWPVLVLQASGGDFGAPNQRKEIQSNITQVLAANG
ncbi:hypothetical protein VNO77_22987 [Canavalia gladiata]|uniref:Uncharacterized protein n=1 Tax=Canavalia gladiata TaxID=3824 RepID=A0AAN9L4I4_CANGL